MSRAYAAVEARRRRAQVDELIAVGARHAVRTPALEAAELRHAQRRVLARILSAKVNGTRTRRTLEAVRAQALVGAVGQVVAAGAVAARSGGALVDGLLAVAAVEARGTVARVGAEGGVVHTRARETRRARAVVDERAAREVGVADVADALVAEAQVEAHAEVARILRTCVDCERTTSDNKIENKQKRF